MADLHPTPTRLAFLAEVTDGQVLVDPYGQARYADQDGKPWGFRCTRLWAEATGAGWADAYRNPERNERWVPAQLTEAGRTLLEALGGDR